MPLQLTDVQVANVAVTAGWRGEDAVTAVAVALAESGGNAQARGDLALQTATWGPSIGLWQVRSLKAQRGTGGDRDELALAEPVGNGLRAHRIWAGAGSSWRPWSTWQTGAYRLYSGRARAAVAGKTVADDGTVAGHTDPTVEGPLAPVANAVRIAARAGQWVADSHNWLRVALAITGAGIVVGGLLVVARPAVASAVDTAGKVIP